MSLAGTVGRVTARHGAAYTIRRETRAPNAQPWKVDPAPVVTYATVKARERGYRANELRDTIQEGDVLVTVDAATCATPPVVGDRVALGVFTDDVGAEWRQIVNVYAARQTGAARVYKLQARR